MVSEDIEAAAVSIIDMVSECSCSFLFSTQFNDIYKAYYEGEDGILDELIDKYVGKTSIWHKIDEKKCRDEIVDTLVRFKSFVELVAQANINVAPLYEEYRYGQHFIDKDYEDKVYRALKIIDECRRRRLSPADYLPDDPHTLLSDLVDANGLVTVEHGKRKGEWLAVNRTCYVWPQWSARDLRDKVIPLIDKEDGSTVCVSLRPIKARELSEVSDSEYTIEALAYGGIFSKSLLDNATGCVDGRYKYSDRSIYKHKIGLIPMLHLDYQIKEMKDGNVSLMIEEVIDYKNLRQDEVNSYIYICDGQPCVRNRLVHAIYNKETEDFTHIDLDFLYYNMQEIEKRIQCTTHIKDVKVKEIKSFRIDGHIPYSTACNIIATSLDVSHNPEVENLLAGRVMNDEERNACKV